MVATGQNIFESQIAQNFQTHREAFQKIIQGIWETI